MARVPRREKLVYFVGAGFSSAFGLPNTQQLLLRAEEWLGAERLLKAYKYFYPIEASGAKGFRPNVVDFFSLLQSHIAVARTEAGTALPGDPFLEAPNLYVELKWAITKALIDTIRDQDLTQPHAKLDQMFRPGSVIITSNWDVLLEAYAIQRGHQISHIYAIDKVTVPILKLHGSVDWTLSATKKPGTDSREYGPLREKLGTHGRRLPVNSDDVTRIRALENLSRAWQYLRARTTQPLMITMAPGKASELEPIRRIWNDAYKALSAAKRIEFIGYSLPQDDVEIRALILAGMERGTKPPSICVQNPAPDVHERFRTYVRRTIDEDYSPFVR